MWSSLRITCWPNSNNLPSQKNVLEIEVIHKNQNLREIEQEERLVREELTSTLPGDPLLGPLQLQTLRRRDPTPALPELSFKVITTRYGTVNHTRYNCLFSNCANNWTDDVWMVQSVP